ncbi:MAG: translesion error-prone DNA polymerase V autoproteolytic subunit [Porticoccaceae bacterium]|nr:translesion error-prone DNA polymerase V autoproteolytic subunit [Porticoccaceae bacterium]
MKLVSLSPAISARVRTTVLLPLYLSRVAAGFPSPADDYLDGGLDLNEHLIAHPAATYFARAEGDSMIDLGIFTGDLLIIDRAVQAVDGDVVVVAIDGELTIKLLDLAHSRLLPANKLYRPIEISPESQVDIEGVVIHAVHHVKGVGKGVTL